MKAFLLTAVTALACSGSVFAQKDLFLNFPPDVRWDVGLNYGASTITRPLGPEKLYQGTRTAVVKEYGAKATYMVSPHFHVAYELGIRKWESFGTWSNPYYQNTALKNTDITFQLGKPSISNSLQFNYVMPFYTKHQVWNKANLYFGATIGMVNTVSDGSTGYSRYNAPPDSSYRYVSSYNYGAAIGVNLGVHAGYSYYFWRRLGVNVEIAARYVSMYGEKVNGIQDNHGTSKYHMMFFPQTVGIRYRMY